MEDGLFNEETNISNGQSSAELGVHIVAGTRMGFFDCPNPNIMHLTSFGYVFKNTEMPFLVSNGALILQDYRLYFSNGNYSFCTGTLNAAYFTTGSNPFDPTNVPLFIYPTRNLTCEMLSGRHYVWPFAN